MNYEGKCYVRFKVETIRLELIEQGTRQKFFDSEFCFNTDDDVTIELNSLKHVCEAINIKFKNKN